MKISKISPISCVVLIILDGFGYRETSEANAIASANAPTWKKLWQENPHTTLSASGLDVGLPRGQMGNSEVGHLTMGAGREIDQDLTRISKAIEDFSFFQNPVLTKAIDTAKAQGSRIHLLGLLSSGGVHSHEDHLLALTKMLKERGVEKDKVILHAFLDGRDTPPKSALSSLQLFEQEHLTIGSICGRYYAMDRDKRFDRTMLTYRLLTEGWAPFQAESATLGLKMAYNRNETDEFVQATIIDKSQTIQDGDSVIFINFRSDRTRQLCYALMDPNFKEFKRTRFPKIKQLLTFTQYASDLTADIIFPPQKLNNLLGEYLALQNIKQLRIAETEKYAHVTYFFNGGKEKPFPGEERILINSPQTATYDLCPEMSAFSLTEELIKNIQSQQYKVIICNYANADMVGHTGNFKATVKAIETLDECLKQIAEVLPAANAEAIITADHGNAEYMFDEQRKQPHTAHTCERVPFIYLGRPAKITHQNGTLADIAPTLLSLLNQDQPKEMTGKPLVELLHV